MPAEQLIQKQRHRHQQREKRQPLSQAMRSSPPSQTRSRPNRSRNVMALAAPRKAKIHEGRAPSRGVRGARVGRYSLGRIKRQGGCFMAPHSELPWDPANQGAMPSIPHLKKESQRESPSKKFGAKKSEPVRLKRRSLKGRDQLTPALFSLSTTYLRPYVASAPS